MDSFEINEENERLRNDRECQEIASREMEMEIDELSNDVPENEPKLEFKNAEDFSEPDKVVPPTLNEASLKILTVDDVEVLVPQDANELIAEMIENEEIAAFHQDAHDKRERIDVNGHMSACTQAGEIFTASVNVLMTMCVKTVLKKTEAKSIILMSASDAAKLNTEPHPLVDDATGRTIRLEVIMASGMPTDRFVLVCQFLGVYDTAKRESDTVLTTYMLNKLISLSLKRAARFGNVLVSVDKSRHMDAFVLTRRTPIQDLNDKNRFKENEDLTLDLSSNMEAALARKVLMQLLSCQMDYVMTKAVVPLIEKYGKDVKMVAKSSEAVCSTCKKYLAKLSDYGIEVEGFADIKQCANCFEAPAVIQVGLMDAIFEDTLGLAAGQRGQWKATIESMVWDIVTISLYKTDLYKLSNEGELVVTRERGVDKQLHIRINLDNIEDVPDLVLTPSDR